MNCPECGRIIFEGLTRCGCGWRVPSHLVTTTHAPIGEASPVMRRAFAERLAVINEFIDKFLIENPGSDKKYACQVYLRERGLDKALPKQFSTPAESDPFA